MKKKLCRFLPRFLPIFLTIQMFLSVCTPTVAFANDAVMLESLIEVQTKTYKVDMIDDKPTWFAEHYEQKYINFNSYYNSICTDASTSSKFDVTKFATNPTLCSSLDSTVSLKYGIDASSSTTETDAYNMYMITEGFRTGTSLIVDDSAQASSTNNGMARSSDFIQNIDKSGMKALTFPSSNDAKDVTEGESSYAIEIGNTLSANLNSMLAFINNGKKFQSVTELVNKSILIRPTNHGFTIVKGDNNSKNFIIVYGTLSSYGGSVNTADSSSIGDFSSFSSFSPDNFWKTGKFANTDINGNLLAYIIPTSQTDITYTNVDKSKMDSTGTASFVWAMPKGYANIPGVGNSLKFTNDKHEQYTFVTEGKDVPWVTIHQLTMYANSAYKNFNISMASKLTSEGNGNVILEILIGIVKMLVNGLRSILGLSDTYSLVFNKGVRGSSSFNYGAMSDSWWTVVLRYHIIFQSLAWFIIIVGLIKTLIDLNLSTINPGKRMHVYKTIERFIVVGFGLVLIIPITQFMLSMNNSIVSIFASQADPSAISPPVIGTLAGLVLQVAYFGIVVYINFTYIMRSIIIGLLIVTAPFFISSMAFSENNKQLFSSWSRELTANIFMQSIHAFTLAFLTNLVATGGGLESLVVSYSIIPITELIRTIVFQGAGQGASQLGKAAGAKYLGAATGAANAVLSAGTGAISGHMDRSSESGDTSMNEGGTGNKGGRGSKGGSDNGLQGLQNSIDTRMNGIKKGANDKITNPESNAKDKMVANAQKFGANMLQAGMSGASALTSIGGAAMDMAMGELNNDNSAYKTAGSSLGNAAVKGAKSINSGRLAVVSGAGAVTQGIDAHGEHKSAIKRTEGQTQEQIQQDAATKNTHDSNMALMPASVNRDEKTGMNVSKFNARAGAKYATEGKNLTETMGDEGIKSMANGNSQLAPFYRDVMKINDGDKALQDSYASKGVIVQKGANGSGAKITMNESFLHNNNISSATAGKDGNSLYTRGSGAAGAFGPKFGASAYKRDDGTSIYDKANPVDTVPPNNKVE